MSILYPSALDGTTQLSQPVGTNLLTLPDHAQAHTNLSILGTAIEGVLGTTAGTGVIGAFKAGDLATRHQGGTFQQVMIGTVNLAGQGTNFGTVTGGMFGTTTIQGGTANNQVVGTPSVVGGTVTNGVFNSGTYGTINAPANNDLVLSAGSAILFTAQRQGGSSTNFSIAGTSNFIEGNLLQQFGEIAYTTAGTPAGTVVFPVAFSEVPHVMVSSGNGTLANIPGVNSITVGSFTFTNERTLNGTVAWFAIGKR